MLPSVPRPLLLRRFRFGVSSCPRSTGGREERRPARRPGTARRTIDQGLPRGKTGDASTRRATANEKMPAFRRPCCRSCAGRTMSDGVVERVVPRPRSAAGHSIRSSPVRLFPARGARRPLPFVPADRAGDRRCSCRGRPARTARPPVGCVSRARRSGRPSISSPSVASRVVPARHRLTRDFDCPTISLAKKKTLRFRHWARSFSSLCALSDARLPVAGRRRCRSAGSSHVRFASAIESYGRPSP